MAPRDARTERLVSRLRLLLSALAVLFLFLPLPGALRVASLVVLAAVSGSYAGEAWSQARARRGMDSLVRQAEEARAALIDGRLRVEEAERRRIARELHDEIGQVLTVLHLSLEMAGRGSPEARSKALEEALRLANDLLARVRNLSLELSPPILDDLGLLPALLWQVERFGKQTGIEVDFRHSGLAGRYSPEVESTAYRVVQEALTNVARHAKVKKVKVAAWVSAQVLTVQVEDSGRGFDPELVLASGETGGLAGMKERASAAGGQLTLESSRGRGTRVTAEVPLGSDRTEQLGGEAP